MAPDTGTPPDDGSSTPPVDPVVVVDPVREAKRLALLKRITEANDAYHDLMTGKSLRTLVDQNGERMEFTVINRDALRNYITALEHQYETEFGSGRTKPVGPMRIFIR